MDKNEFLYKVETTYRRTPSTDSSLEEAMKHIYKLGNLRIEWLTKSGGKKSLSMFYFDKEYVCTYKEQGIFIEEELQSEFFKKVKILLDDLGFKNQGTDKPEKSSKGKIIDYSKIISVNQKLIDFEEKTEKKGETLENEEEHNYQKQIDILLNSNALGIFDKKFKKMLPREYQKEAIDAAVNGLIESRKMHGQGKGMLVLPTGYGKTAVSAAVSSRLKELRGEDEKNKPFRVLFLVHKNDIIYQTAKLFGKDMQGPFTSYFGPENIGMMIGGEKTFQKSINNIFTGKINDVICANIKTMEGQLETFPKDYFDVIVADECHRSIGATYKACINYFDYKYLLGVTATPDRTDTEAGLTVEALFNFYNNNVMYQKELLDAINENILAKPLYFIRSNGINENIKNEITRQLLYKTYNGSLAPKGKKEDIFEKFSMFENDANFLYKEKKRTVVFCENIDIAEETYKRIGTKFPGNTIRMFGREEYKNAKGKTLSKVGEVITPEILERRIKEFKEFDVDKKGGVFIVVVDLFIEGTDIPEIDSMMMMRPTTSSRIYFQVLGRGLRKTETKDSCLVFDYNFNTIRLELFQEKINLLKKINIKGQIDSKLKNYYDGTLNYIEQVNSFISEFENYTNEQKRDFKTKFRNDALRFEIAPKYAKEIFEFVKKNKNNIDGFKNDLLSIIYKSSLLGEKQLFSLTENSDEKLLDLLNSTCIDDIIKNLEDCYITETNQFTFLSESSAKGLVNEMTELQKEKLKLFLDKNKFIGDSYQIIYPDPANQSEKDSMERFGNHLMYILFKRKKTDKYPAKFPIF